MKPPLPGSTKPGKGGFCQVLSIRNLDYTISSAFSEGDESPLSCNKKPFPTHAEKHILRAKAKSEVLRIAHGHQRCFKDIDPAAFSVERYARRRVIPNDILFQCAPSVKRA